MTASKSFVYRFADMEAREREFLVTRAGEALTVEPKAFRVLLFLLRNPQRLIAKEELLNAVWGDAAVTENSLTRAILKLRKALEDDPREPRFIETVATVGYRWVCDVEVSDADAGGGASPEEPAAFGPEKKGPSRSRLLGWALAAGAALAVGLACVNWYLRRPLPTPRITGYTKITNDGREKYLAGTDGNRLYFTRMSPRSIAQVGISGGEIVPVPVAVPVLESLADVSPDGSSLLVFSGTEGSTVAGPLWNVRILGGSLRRLGDAASATFSPDGKSVAYSTADGSIYVVRSDGTGAHSLGSAGQQAGNLAWSPDGQVIRFTGDNRLWEISSSGSNLHELLPGWRASDLKCCGRWTSDGRFFVFLVQPENQSRQGGELWALDERRGLFQSPSAEPVQLTAGPLGWSTPISGIDGKRIYAVGQTSRGELLRFDAQTKQFQPYLGGISAFGAAFSRDGRSVAYVSWPEGILWKANRDGSSPVQLTDPPIMAFQPRWSPDGTRIVFADGASFGHARIYTVSSEGGGLESLLPAANGDQADPNWSADGKKVAFATGENSDSKSDLRILDLASRQVMTVPGSTGMFSPRWSPDGRFIAALSYDSLSLRIFDVEAQQWSTAATKGYIGYPCWSKDSQWIYFLRWEGDQAMYRIRIAGGGVERVADLRALGMTGWGGTWMGLDPTDSPLMLRDIGSNDIYALMLDAK